MRIGIITHKYPDTKEDHIDAGIHIYDFAHRLAKLTPISVLAFDRGKEKKQRVVSVTWFPWKSGPNLLRLWVSAFFLFIRGRRAVITFARDNRIDFLLCAWGIPAGYFGYYLKRTLGIPYAVWALGSDIHMYARYPVLRYFIAVWLKDADLRFANSFCLRDEVMRLSGKDCTFMPVISDFPTFSQKKRPNLRKPFQFLYVGRLERVKGIDMLIHACTLLKKWNEPFRLDIVGDGYLRNQLEKEVREKGFDEDIAFLGNQDKDSVFTHMRNAECLVIPSRNESFPQVLLEAAKVGLPAIATDVGDCRRIFATFRCGILVENNNSESLAEAMAKCIGVRRHLQKIYRKRLQTFVKNFTAVRPEVILMQKLRPHPIIT